MVTYSSYNIIYNWYKYNEFIQIKMVGTQVSGYMAKELLSAMQTSVLGEKDSDCGTTKTISVSLTNKNYNKYLYRYIKVGQKYVMLTNDKTNIGLATSKIATTITQLNLQKFHQNLVKTQTIDVDDMLL